MLNAKKIAVVHNMPVYFQRMPEAVKSVSMGIILFTGAADDETVGSPGLYHWFEHVPFRGTKKYPDGALDLEKPIVRKSGRINAWTNLESTCYHGTVHIGEWRRLLSSITDLVAQPLITEEAVEAERKIIHQEISGKLGSADGWAWYHLYSIIYGNHPFGHHTLGNRETLALMDVGTLRTAHQHGYDRSRATIVIFGNIPEDELLAELNGILAVIPDRHLAERHRPAYHGPLPDIGRGITHIETKFATSVVKMLFPLPANRGDQASMADNTLIRRRLQGLIEYGGTTGPLGRILRLERHLVYGANVTYDILPGGGYFGFEAEAERANIQQVVQGFKDVISDPLVTSQTRIDEIKEAIAPAIEMQPIDPASYRKETISQLQCLGGAVMSQDEIVEHTMATTVSNAQSALSLLDLSKARIIIFEGTG